jgi:hypothetical protein
MEGYVRVQEAMGDRGEMMMTGTFVTGKVKGQEI